MNMQAKSRLPQAFDPSLAIDEVDVGQIEAELGTGDAPRKGHDDSQLAPASAAGAGIAAHMRLAMRSWRWVKLSFWAFSGLFCLWLGVSLQRFITGLFAENMVLGALALCLAGLAGFALAALAIGEWLALRRFARVRRLRKRLEQVVHTEDVDGARQGALALARLYQDHPGTARGRHRLAGHLSGVFGARDLVGLAEREILEPIDRDARQFVMRAARHVSIATALSPRALLDLLLVGYETLRLIRRLGALYCGRGGNLLAFRLMHRIFATLLISGGMAASESLLSQFIGPGLAGRLSARWGEGVVNGYLVARIGIIAAELCRPAPYQRLQPPRMQDIMRALFAREGQAHTEGQQDAPHAEGTRGDAPQRKGPTA